MFSVNSGKSTFVRTSAELISKSVLIHLRDKEALGRKFVKRPLFGEQAEREEQEREAGGNGAGG